MAPVPISPRLQPMRVTYPTKIQLAFRSGDKCAMPDCRRRLSVSSGGNDAMIGEAAHIAGGQEGGSRGNRSARFDPAMEPGKLNSLSNLIYICRNCHAEIDEIPRGETKYPTDRLLEIKAEHEEAVLAATEEALSEVSFRELEEATKWVTEDTFGQSDPDFSRIRIDAKIAKNGLSISNRNFIGACLRVTPQVRSFIQFVSQEDPSFPDRLKAGFLKHYYQLRQDGVSSGEVLFDSMCLIARRGFTNHKTQCAAHSVLVYLFETCEVFEK